VSVPVLQGLREVAGNYDGFVLDLWGVVHDGVTVFPGVVDALRQLHAAKKKLVFLSNAPRPSGGGAVRRFRHHGFPA
jgi:ribonucleotide monophosphatase NagD (HAD superfamily)